MSTGDCKNKVNCFYADTGCLLGHADSTDCPHWLENIVDSKVDTVKMSGAKVASQVLWTGRALGTMDLLPVASRGYLSVIGLVGSADAGKTTFLIALYLLILREGKIGTYEFAGSLTLAAWEGLASLARHSANHSASFPPHTTSTDRVPSLLHMSFRDKEGTFRDVVFTDTPGEWFNRWASSVDDVAAEGARWVIRNSDGLLLFADSQALAGSQRGVARAKLTDLMRRLGSEAKGRPVTFIWAKSDVILKEDIQNQLKLACRDLMPLAKECSISIHTEAGCNQISTLVGELLDSLIFQKIPKVLEEPRIDTSPFLVYRGDL